MIKQKSYLLLENLDQLNNLNTDLVFLFFFLVNLFQELIKLQNVVAWSALLASTMQFLDQFRLVLISQIIKGIVKRAGLNKSDICLVSRILWHKRITCSLKCRLWGYILTGNFLHNFSLRKYAVPLQRRLLIFIRKNLWCWALKANKKHIIFSQYF